MHRAAAGNGGGRMRRFADVTLSGSTCTQRMRGLDRVSPRANRVSEQG
uniref:Uncharacterized protein n=1 Tax=Streptomyces sp. KCTC 11604BP TaxID=941587 RepID=E9KTG0_9ACTN|nr:hypothetical protein Tcs_11604BP_006 [Streptomyces sp. KCTC 11604BP]